jgi:hypothetical protein
MEIFSSISEYRVYRKRSKNEKIAEHKQTIRALRNTHCKVQEKILNEKIAEHEAAMLGKGCSWKFDTSVFSTDKNIHDIMRHEQKVDVAAEKGLVKPLKGNYFDYDY